MHESLLHNTTEVRSVVQVACKRQHAKTTTYPMAGVSGSSPLTSNRLKEFGKILLYVVKSKRLMYKSV
jgi:hypothetical protein